MKKKYWYIIAGAGVVVLILAVVLASLLLRGDEASAPEIAVPESEFVFNSEEEYGEYLSFSTEVENELFSEMSERAREEIIKRISAWFAINYPEYDTFALVKDSYKKTESDEEVKVSAKLVSNLGTLVGLEMIDTMEDWSATKTAIRILTSSGEEAYKTEINWEEI